VLVLALTSTAVLGQDEWQSAYRIGDAVELKITDQIWQSCRVSENPPGGIMRVNCSEYVEPSPGTYTRAGGVYIDYGKSDLCAAGSATTAASTVPAARSPAPAAAAAPAPAATGNDAAPPVAGEPVVNGLRVGEYACYGSGGTILAGFAFQVLLGGRYADLDNADSGTYGVDAVTFSGGHLDGTEGRELNRGNFRIGRQATCEPF
jgi:hypothetical protein